MSRKKDERGDELRNLFFESAYELLQSLNESGLALEANPADEEILRSVRRAVHTLKGDSAACGYQSLSELAHELEDVLSPSVGQREGGRLAEVVLSVADTFELLLGAYKKNADIPSTDAVRKQIRELLESGEGAEPKTAVRAGAPAGSGCEAQFAWTEYEQLMVAEALHRGEMVYNIALRIDPQSAMRAAAFQLVRNVLHGAGTLIALRPEDNAGAANVDLIEASLSCTETAEGVVRRCKIPSIVKDVQVVRVKAIESPEHEMIGDILEAQAAAAARAAEGPSAAAIAAPAVQEKNAVATAVAESMLRVEASRIDSVMNLVGELIIGKSMLHRAIMEFGQKYSRDPLHGKLSDALSFQSRILEELQKSVVKIRMVPVEQLFRRFPRVVRDVAKQCKKDVALELSGESTDLDKGVLDTLGEPLAHLVRNAVDHGIEPAEARIAAGKPARGTLYLNAYHQGTQVVVEVRDDGGGIQAEKVRAKVVARGILSQQEADKLNDREVLNMIFAPGFSTAAEVTEISGRGVGLDIVRTVLERLKGTVEVSSQPGKGTTFQLRMPLTLASIQTLLFHVGGRMYAVPLSAVLEITRVTEPEIRRVDQKEVLQLRDRVLPVVRLSRLNRIHAVGKSKRSFVIVIGVAEKKFGLLVDSLAGEEELVIKALPADLACGDLVTGASVLGDGSVVLILNVNAVVSRLSRTPLMEASA
ncbi:MAG: chemotaxis protein CheA [Acidobacteriia bacterium]|nr:chemotaxis protein CheA [Terriglobia bacterium]